VTGGELVDLVGMPDFLTGCTVTGDLSAVASGQPVVLRLQAHVSVADDRRSVVVENLPPNAVRWDVISDIADRARRRPAHSRLGCDDCLPIEKMEDISREGDDRFICVPEPGTAPEHLRDLLLEVGGITTSARVALPRPLPALIRRWVRAYSGEDLLASLGCLEDAICRQPSWG
jgi:hypothetical protein